MAALAVGVLVLTPAHAALANSSQSSATTYSGQGVEADGFGGYDLSEELCGTANGAEVDGPYLLWVFTSTKSSSATITGPWGSAPMIKKGNGAFHYVSAWYDPGDLIGVVSASGNGSTANPQLVISHGCRPFEDRGAWCSPGFWRNAESAAWTHTGYTRDDSFNASVPPFWFGDTFSADPTLGTVLSDAPTYSGAPVPGTSGYPLNAFNATGAMLTDALPGYSFSLDVMMSGSDDACPLDHHGNFK
jgi:hypothetical protein